MIIEQIKATVLDATIETFKKGLQNFATDPNWGAPTKPSEVQIWFATKDEQSCQPFAFLVKDGKPFIYKRMFHGSEVENDEILFEDILNVNNDLQGIGVQANFCLAYLFKKLSEELQTDPRNIELLITTPNTMEEIVPVPFLYDRGLEGNQFVKQLRWEEDVFTDDAVKNLLAAMQGEQPATEAQSGNTEENK